MISQAASGINPESLFFGRFRHCSPGGDLQACQGAAQVHSR